MFQHSDKLNSGIALMSSDLRAILAAAKFKTNDIVTTNDPNFDSEYKVVEVIGKDNVAMYALEDEMGSGHVSFFLENQLKKIGSVKVAAPTSTVEPPPGLIDPFKDDEKYFDRIPEHHKEKPHAKTPGTLKTPEEQEVKNKIPRTIQKDMLGPKAVEPVKGPKLSPAQQAIEDGKKEQDDFQKMYPLPSEIKQTHGPTKELPKSMEQFVQKERPKTQGPKQQEHGPVMTDKNTGKQFEEGKPFNTQTNPDFFKRVNAPTTTKVQPTQKSVSVPSHNKGQAPEKSKGQNSWQQGPKGGQFRVGPGGRKEYRHGSIESIYQEAGVEDTNVQVQQAWAKPISAWILNHKDVLAGKNEDDSIRTISEMGGFDKNQVQAVLDTHSLFDMGVGRVSLNEKLPECESCSLAFPKGTTECPYCHTDISGVKKKASLTMSSIDRKNEEIGSFESTGGLTMGTMPKKLAYGGFGPGLCDGCGMYGDNLMSVGGYGYCSDCVGAEDISGSVKVAAKREWHKEAVIDICGDCNLPKDVSICQGDMLCDDCKKKRVESTGKPCSADLLVKDCHGSPIKIGDHVIDISGQGDSGEGIVTNIRTGQSGRPVVDYKNDVLGGKISSAAPDELACSSRSASLRSVVSESNQGVIRAMAFNKDQSLTEAIQQVKDMKQAGCTRAEIRKELMDAGMNIVTITALFKEVYGNDL